MTQWTAVALALLSAGCLAVGSHRQSRAVRAHTGRERPRAGLLTVLASPGYLTGLALVGIGTVLNVGALAVGTVTVVQPLGMLALVVTALLQARDERVPVPARTWAAVALCTTGGAALVVCAVHATD
ncbi:MAG: DMT family transporter, partial [Actinomycetota bacterium]